ncbi:MAG: endo alpha-1,4 polygalactosaminidase [Gammaproteobacteria bacterium]|nr:endo alpha-1,4 polygalactosaminidase [Gammaproteobacteria bacterium]
MVEHNLTHMTKPTNKTIYGLFFCGAVACASSPGHAVNEAIVESDLSISIPVLRFGSDYFQVGLSYANPNWVVNSASEIDSTEAVSAIFEGSTLTINCLVYNDSEYTLTMNLDVESSSLALGTAAENPGCADALGSGKPSLAKVSTWFYMIDVNLEQDMVEKITASEYDMVVLDFIPSEANNTDFPMAAVVAELQSAPKPKLVMAYIDIGQAEDFRSYWQPGWGVGNPEWITALDPDGWEGNFPVAYWHDDWRDIWLGVDGYLQDILDLGFDGVYLDWIEAYSDDNIIAAAQQDGVDPRQEMIWWVTDIANFTRNQQPNFIVIGQNAAELVADDEYLNAVDAIAQEQVWFDGAADNDPPGDCPLPRTEADVETNAYVSSLSTACREQYETFTDSTLHVSSEAYISELALAREKGVIVFTVDYALQPDNVNFVFETSRALGFVPFASNRALNLFFPPTVIEE